MQITFKKSKLIVFYQLLNAVKAKGRKSRAVTKFNKLIVGKIEELQEDEKTLIAQYFEVGEDGNAKRDSEDNLVALEGADVAEYEKEWQELHEEDVIIDLTEYKPYFEFLQSALEDWEQDLSGNDAIVYDELMDEIEKVDAE